MRELTQVLRFSPRTIEDEMRIYRAKPIAWTDSSVALLNEYGATLCTPDREATSLDLPEADEKEKSPPNPPLLPLIPPAIKTPVKNTVGAVSHAGSKSARMEQKRKLRKKILSCLFSL